MSKIYVDLLLKSREMKKKIQRMRQLWQSASNKSAVCQMNLVLRINGKDYSDPEMDDFISKHIPVATILTGAMSQIDANISTYAAEAKKFLEEEVNGGV